MLWYFKVLKIKNLEAFLLYWYSRCNTDELDIYVYNDYWRISGRTNVENKRILILTFWDCFVRLKNLPYRIKNRLKTNKISWATDRCRIIIKINLIYYLVHIVWIHCELIDIYRGNNLKYQSIRIHTKEQQRISWAR